MDTQGPQQPRATRNTPVPPPRPTHTPGPGGAPQQSRAAEFLAWLRAPRPTALPGIWRLGHRPRPAEEPELIPARQLLSGALIAFLCGWLLWSLLWNSYLGDFWLWPLLAVIPDHWFRGAADGRVAYSVSSNLYYLLVAGGIMVAVGRLGRWSEVWRRYLAPRFRRSEPQQAPAAAPQEDPAHWPHLRAAGAAEAADKLAAEAGAGRMRDVDLARIERAWQSVASGRHPLDTFTRAVLSDGAAACLHPSGARDLTTRTARHDLRTGQVRLGKAADDQRNPYAYRGTGLALGPELLGTSFLAVGPSGSGKTGAVIRPLAEALCLQALAGRAAVVVVGAAGAGLGPAENYDVVIRIGHPDSEYDFDLYGGTTDPDEAAAVLAEALVGDLADPHPGADSRRSSTVLAQLLGPYRAVHGRFPSVPELRELLDGAPVPLAELRKALDEAGDEPMLRELDARERQSGASGDPGAVLADRVALLDRPAFAGFFDTTGRAQPFSLRALDHPVRVRIDLPERGHADASRILARLVLAQFTASAAHREDRSLFACLILDDAARTITPEAVRGIQRLRSANAGTVLTLRTLDEVAPPLRTALLGAAGCRMALSGVTPWDGQQFAEVWGKEWIEARDVTDRQIVADEPLTKVSHFVRKVITGRAPTAQSVTVRQVERERWSASELAHSVPPGHAVLSLTTVRGEHAPPLLVDLRG
ncbi:ATP-binding protein [Streptomyces sp. TRM66268-LWL]|uniref:ATP-binding protein n=1 Tax=Streptomyces polyasparticus TaxID=2767826 RepID=A0ABR7S8D9_9ACTN|nr:ATP-binding protein [Streptomyces polyasparticus]MBC9711725.1 ATP-binding protein [Streptomyces polyasparticus]